MCTLLRSCEGVMNKTPTMCVDEIHRSLRSLYKGELLMHVVAVSPLPVWENFYVIVGTAAATLTGLMFVVITLTSRLGQRSGSGVAAFGTPTVVHFSVALLLAAMLCAPWQALWHVGLALGVCGIGSFIYTFVVVRRMFRQTSYKPVMEDDLSIHRVYCTCSCRAYTASHSNGGPVCYRWGYGSAFVYWYS